jgi:hypothetical protein
VLSDGSIPGPGGGQALLTDQLQRQGMQDLQQLREDVVPRLVENNALGPEDRVEQEPGGRVIGPLLEVEQLFLVLQPDEADTLLRVVSGTSSEPRATKRASHVLG